MNIRKGDLKKLVYTEDTDTLLQDGLYKVTEGLTTVEEILRLIELDFDEQYQGKKVILNDNDPTPQPLNNEINNSSDNNAKVGPRTLNDFISNNERKNF